MKPSELKVKIEAYEHAAEIVRACDDPAAMGWEVVQDISRRLVSEIEMLRAMKPAKEREKTDA